MPVVAGGQKVQTYQYAHKLVAKTCKELAEHAYEHMASRNEFYALFPNQKKWMQAHWHMFRDEGRKVLANYMASPTCPEHLKEVIAQALIDDNQLAIRSGQVMQFAERLR